VLTWSVKAAANGHEAMVKALLEKFNTAVSGIGVKYCSCLVLYIRNNLYIDNSQKDAKNPQKHEKM
jgi:hypothetical protein